MVIRVNSSKWCGPCVVGVVFIFCQNLIGVSRSALCSKRKQNSGSGIEDARVCNGQISNLKSILDAFSGCRKGFWMLF